MSEQNYANVQQQAELMKYISDNMKIPVLGAGGGFAPIGTLNYYMGTVAPQGWLICDGTVYDIADYPEFATFIASNYGSTNAFGGDGVTTFAVPDCRGEFARMIGTNSHANQGNGGAVGEHQDSTTILNGYIDMPNNEAYIGFPGSGEVVGNKDSRILTGTDWNYVKGIRNSEVNRYKSTIRPTNTSWNFIVKATVSGDANGHVYSTDEQIVGTWIDGKTLYERTIVYNSPTTGSDALTIGTINNMDYGFVKEGHYVNNNSDFAAIRATLSIDSTGRNSEATTYTSYACINPDGKVRVYFGSTTASTKIIVVVQYTKNS